MSKLCPNLRQPFYRDRLRAILACDSGACRLEIVADASKGAPSHLHLEMLLQPRDERDLPYGPARSLYVADVPLFGLRERWLVGEALLPRAIPANLAARCHFRLTPIRWMGKCIDSPCQADEQSNAPHQTEKGAGTADGCAA